MSAMATSSPLHNRNIGFIGAGAMASAIIKGLLASGISPGSISASDPWEPARAKAKALGLNVTGNAEVAIVSEIIVVAVKPDVVAHQRWHPSNCAASSCPSAAGCAIDGHRNRRWQRGEVRADHAEHALLGG